MQGHLILRRLVLLFFSGACLYPWQPLLRVQLLPWFLLLHGGWLEGCWRINRFRIELGWEEHEPSTDFKFLLYELVFLSGMMRTSRLALRMCSKMSEELALMLALCLAISALSWEDLPSNSSRYIFLRWRDILADSQFFLIFLVLSLLSSGFNSEIFLL